MLIELGIYAFDSVALLTGPGLTKGISIGGADGAGNIGSCVWWQFLHMRAPTRKIVRVIRIMTDGEMKVQ